MALTTPAIHIEHNYCSYPHDPTAHYCTYPHREQLLLVPSCTNNYLSEWLLAVIFLCACIRWLSSRLTHRQSLLMVSTPPHGVARQLFQPSALTSGGTHVAACCEVTLTKAYLSK